MSAPDPTFILAAAEQFQGIMYVARLIGHWVVTLAPFLVVAAFAYAAMLWVFAGDNPRMVKKARDQFQRALIGLIVIAGYFMLKGIIYGLTLDPFGT